MPLLDKSSAVVRDGVSEPGASASVRPSRAYWLAWLASVTFFAGFYALLVPLPRYLGAVGLPDWQIGLVLGAFGVASLIGRPIAGAASDHFGPRRVMLTGTACLAVGAVATPLTGDVVALFALRMLQAFGYVAFTTASTALVVLLVRPDERAQRLAVFGAAANLAISLTPAAIAAMLDIAPVQSGFVAAAAFGGLGGLLALQLPAAVGQAAQSPANWLIPRRVWLPMLQAGLLGAGFASFFQFAPILAERREVSSGLLYATYGVAIIATRVAGGRLLDRLAVGHVVALATMLMLVGDTLAALSGKGQIPVLMIAAALIAASGGLFHPALLAHHAALLPQTPGRASADFYIAFDLGNGLGSWLFGIALQLADVSGLYATAAVIVALTLPLAVYTAQRHA